jgi:uncharacterized repeat protein (TIGR01451 family)
LLAVSALTALFAVPFVPALAGDNGNSNDKQTICHATASDTNPYVINTPDKNGDVDGHAGHTGPVWTPTLKANHDWWGDIIPPFDYNDHGTAAHFAGLNWTANGQAWFDNGCRVPITVAVDKTNDADGDATFGDDETAATVGAAVAFKVVVTNTSVVPAVLTALTDAVDGSSVAFACDPDVVGSTLAAGESTTCLVTLAGYSPADGTSVVNTVTATLEAVGDPSNHGSASDTSTVRTFVPNPDVSIVKSGPATAAPGDDLTWTLAVHNDGNVPLPDVTVTDTLPQGTTLVSATGTGWTCTGDVALSCVLAGDLAVGDSSSITVVATLAADYEGTTVSNTGVVTPTDSTPDDNTSTVVTDVTQPPGGGGGGGGGGGTVTPPTGDGGGFTGGGGLPFTGMPFSVAVTAGLGAVLLGGALLAVGRRRTA